VPWAPEIITLHFLLVLSPEFSSMHHLLRRPELLSSLFAAIVMIGHDFALHSGDQIATSYFFFIFLRWGEMESTWYVGH
jgi:hypothetical protein